MLVLFHLNCSHIPGQEEHPQERHARDLRTGLWLKKKKKILFGKCPSPMNVSITDWLYLSFLQAHYNHLHQWFNHKWDFIVMQATEQYKYVKTKSSFSEHLSLGTRVPKDKCLFVLNNSHFERSRCRLFVLELYFVSLGSCSSCLKGP